MLEELGISFGTAVVVLTALYFVVKWGVRNGIREAVQEKGLLGAFTGGLTAGAAGTAAAVFFGYLAALVAKPKDKS